MILNKVVVSVAYTYICKGSNNAKKKIRWGNLREKTSLKFQS